MSSICGVFNKRGNLAEEADIKKMLKALNHWGADNQWVNCKASVAFGKLSFRPISNIGNESLFVSTLNADRRTSENQLESIIQKGNLETLKKIYGNFVFAFYAKNTLTLGRDHFGCKPLFYYDSNEIFAFSSEIKGLLSLFDIPKKLSEEWLLDLFSNSISKKDITPYREIKRLEPGHILKVTPNKTEKNQYWDLIHKENKTITENEAASEFRRILIRSIKENLQSSYPVGSELSGGLDSSVVASVANTYCTNQNIPFFSLSHLNPDKKTFPFKDEKEYIQQVVNHSNIKNPLFIDSKNKDILSSIDTSLDLMDGPTQQRFYLFSDSLFETAKKNNIHTLLSGFGGDEMVTSQTPGYYHELASHNWRQFLITQMKSKKSLSKKLKTLFEISISTRIPVIYHIWLSFAGQERKRISDNFFKNNALKPEIIKKYDLVERALKKSRFPNQPSVYERQYQRIMHPHLPQRMEYSDIAALHHGIEYRYPLLDVRLVEFYYSLPTHLKIKGDKRRYIYRQAIKDLVPESIRWKEDKSGATIPSVQKRFLNDYENITKFITHCKKNSVGAEYFNFDAMLKWQEAIKNRTGKNKVPVHQGQFFNFLMLLKFLDKF